MAYPAGMTVRSGSFYVKYKLNGTWVRKCVGDNYQKALEEYAELRGPSRGPIEATSLLSECFQAWVLSQEARGKPATVVNSNTRMRVVLRYMGDVRVDQITPLVAEQYIKTRRKMVKPITINAELRALRGALKHTLPGGRLPCRIRDLPAPKHKSLTPFTTDEVHRLLDHAEPRIRLLLMLAADCGLRRDELLHLQWKDIEIRERRIFVREKEYKYRRMSGEVVERQWTPKSHQARVVFIGAQSVESLEAFRKAARWGADGDWVFQNARRGGRWTDPSKALRHAFRAAGLYESRKLTHALRHSFATAALAGGLDLKTLGEILGHAHMSTTAGYLHVIEARKRQAPQLAGLVDRPKRKR